MVDRLATALRVYRSTGLIGVWFGLNHYLLNSDPRTCFLREHIKTIQRMNDLTVAEIGVWEGEHARTLQNQLDIERLYLIDSYEDYNGYTDLNGPRSSHRLKHAKRKARARLAEYDNITWIEQRSENAPAHLSESLDYVYIDGNHAYEYVLNDIETYYSLLRPGGVLAGHDFSGEWPGVVEAVVEFSNVNDVPFRLEDPGTDWFFVKPNE